MKIRIDFADIPEDIVSIGYETMETSLVDYILDNYFNGAENAVKYIRTDLDFEYVELELMPG